LRFDLVEKVTNRLMQDAKRGDGMLSRTDVNRAYLRRGLTIAECGEVERRLIANEVRISDENATDDVRNSNGRTPVASHRYLSETEERALGRAIQLARKFGVVDGASNDIFRAKLLADADKARATLVITNQRYVRQLAYAKGARKHLTVDDIYQEGMLGL